MDFEKLAEVFENRPIINEINSVTHELGHHFKDVTKVEKAIYKNVIRTIERGVVENVSVGFVRRLARREAFDLIKRNKYTADDYIGFGELDSQGEDGSQINYEPLDSQAQYDGQELELNELLDDIAPKEDTRRRIIATEWLNGNTNDRDIARFLVEELGGKLKTHTTFITRYRKECQLILGGNT